MNGTKPVHGAIGGGSIKVVINLIESALFQTDINFMIPVDMQPIFGIKIGYISGIVTA